MKGFIEVTFHDGRTDFIIPYSELVSNACLIEDAPLIRAELIAARERIAQLEAAAAWRPISEWDHALHAHLVYRRIPTEPTHFRPLPEAPITTDAEGGDNNGA
jgi:hypothetical protein